jgi:hypothetical protein
MQAFARGLARQNRAPLLRLSAQERRGLEWVRQRAGWWIRAMARRRKYLPRGGYGEDEAATLRALIALEAAAGELLQQPARKSDEDSRAEGTIR